jgi:single-strand DNA-binding protein
MASINKVILVGNLGKDPEIRFTKAGEPIASFSLATSDSWTDKAGEKHEKTEWHKVVVFGPQAKIAQNYLAKGKQVYIEGAMVYGEFTTKEGTKRPTAEVHVKGFYSRITLLGSKPDTAPEPSEDVPF